MKESNKSPLPPGWGETAVGNLVGYDGVFCDGDWVESKDQNPAGDVRLIQLADVGDGTYRDKSHRFLTSSKAAELRCTYLQPGDLLFARMPDPLGRVCIFPGDAKASVTVVDVCVLRLSSPTHSRWLMHHLNAPQMRQHVAALQSGSTRKRISRGNFAKIRFPLPPLGEQARIADALDELLSDLEAGVASLERAREKLKLYRASVLRAAMEGALTAEWRQQHPQTEPASELLKRILVERRRGWEEEQLHKFKEKGRELPKNWKGKYKDPKAPDTTDLPPLPEGWCWVTLDQVFQVERGRFSVRPRNDPRYYGGKIPFVQIGELPREGGVIGTYSQTLNEDGLEISKKFEAGTVLIAIVGATIGNTGILNFDACCPDSLVALRSDTSALLRFAELFLRTKKLGLRVAASASGGQPNINLEVLEPLPIPLASFDEIEAIVDAAEDQLSIIDHLELDLELKLKSAQGLRQSILRDAFSGKLVRQDPRDEPASQLLNRIAAERATRVHDVATAKKLNGYTPRRADKERAGANKKETWYGRIADR